MKKVLALLFIAGFYLFLCLSPAHALIPGDVNNDLSVNLSDIIYLVNYIFKGGPSPAIRFSGDVNANCQTNLTDLIYLVNYVFKSGPVPDGCPPWGEPQNLGPPVNSEDGAGSPFISADGKTLYFDRGADIYYSNWNGSSWSVPAKIPGKVNSINWESRPFITGDNKKLFFESNRPGGFGYLDIWMSVWDSVNNEWGQPTNLGPYINTAGLEGAPSLTADNNKLYFEAGGIFVSNWDGTGWGPRLALEIINKNGTEQYPSISIDGKTLYFIRWNIYGPQIYVSYWENGDWSEAENLGFPVNDTFRSLGPCISYDGLSLYFASDRPGSLSGSDIWVSHR